MKRSVLTAKQFVIWLILWCLMGVSWLALDEHWISMTNGVFVFANIFLLQSPEERARPVKARELTLILLGLALFAAVMIVLCKWFPTTGTEAKAMIRQSVVVVPVWILVAWLMVRRWWSSRKEEQNVAENPGCL